MHGRARLIISIGGLAGLVALAAWGRPGPPGASPPSRARPPAAASVNLHKLVLGDKRYVTQGPKKGWVYSCQSQFNGGGAFQDGPWINGKTWDATQKIAVSGAVHWNSSFTNT